MNTRSVFSITTILHRNISYLTTSQCIPTPHQLSLSLYSIRKSLAKCLDCWTCTRDLSSILRYSLDFFDSQVLIRGKVRVQNITSLHHYMRAMKPPCLSTPILVSPAHIVMKIPSNMRLQYGLNNAEMKRKTKEPGVSKILSTLFHHCLAQQVS